MTEQVINAINTDELSTLLIPINGKQLILPNVSVAEIITYVEPQAIDNSPGWLKGFVEWRTQPVPLMSFEEINQEEAIESPARRIAILNGIVDGSKLPFCAILCTGVPRAMRIKPKEIVAVDESDLGEAEQSVVMVNGERAVIPDLDWLQEQLLKVL
jgi:chemosensory pili system protein ChpC